MHEFIIPVTCATYSNNLDTGLEYNDLDTDLEVNNQ